MFKRLTTYLLEKVYNFQTSNDSMTLSIKINNLFTCTNPNPNPNPKSIYLFRVHTAINPNAHGWVQHAELGACPHGCKADRPEKIQSRWRRHSSGRVRRHETHRRVLGKRVWIMLWDASQEQGNCSSSEHQQKCYILKGIWILLSVFHLHSII